MPARAIAARKPQAPSESSSLLNPDRLKQLYSTMLQCRMLSERGKQFPQQDRFTTGKEAVMAGCGVNLKPEDYLVSSHPAAALARGTALELAVAQCYATSDNPGISFKLGLGMALIFQKQSRGLITLACVNKEPWQDAASYAGKHKLPVVFIVSGPGPGRSGIPTIDVDANDVVAIYRVTQEGIRRAREGHGPTLIFTHIAADSASDPLESMEQYLRARRLWSDTWKQRLVKDFNSELDLVVNALERATRF